MDRGSDGGVDVGNADDRDKGHHLLFIDEDVIGFRFAEEQLRGRRNVQANGFGEYCSVTTDEIAIHDRMRTTRAFTLREYECLVGESLDLCRVELHGAGLLQ